MANTCSIFKHSQIPYSDEQAEKYAAEVGVVPRPQEIKDEIDERGAFIRQSNAFVQPFGNRKTDLSAEKGRYAIYWAHGCHWSNRPVIVRDILGLQDVIADVATTHSGETNKYGHGFGDSNDIWNTPHHRDRIYN